MVSCNHLMLFKKGVLGNFSHLFNRVSMVYMNSFMISLYYFLKMVTIIISSLFLSFPFSLPLLPLIAISYLIPISISRSISTFASYKNLFFLVTPTCRTLCPVCSICRYSILQNGRLSSLVFNIYTWQGLDSQDQLRSQKMGHSTFCTILYSLRAQQDFLFILQANITSKPIINIQNCLSLVLMFISLNCLRYCHNCQK